MVQEAVAPLPWKLREEVLGYAYFVESVVEERAAQLGFALEKPQRDRVVFISSLLHLRDVVAGQLALARMAAHGPAIDGSPDGPRVSGLQAGSQDIFPGSPYLRQLADLRGELDAQFRQADIPPNAHRLSDAIELVASTE